jgi:hypothetical protein
MSESARTAAAEIVALVNARPRTPRPEQIEAIVAKAITLRGSEARYRPYPLEAKWNALIREWEAAWQRVADAQDAAKGEPAPQVEAAVAQCVARLEEEIDALVKRIMDAPEPTLDYARLMVRVCYYVMWGDDWRAPHHYTTLATATARIVEGLSADVLAALMTATWAIQPMEERHG